MGKREVFLLKRLLIWLKGLVQYFFKKKHKQKTQKNKQTLKLEGLLKASSGVFHALPNPFPSLQLEETEQARKTI